MNTFETIIKRTEQLIEAKTKNAFKVDGRTLPEILSTFCFDDLVDAYIVEYLREILANAKYCNDIGCTIVVISYNMFKDIFTRAKLTFTEELKNHKTPNLMLIQARLEAIEEMNKEYGLVYDIFIEAEMY